MRVARTRDHRTLASAATGDLYSTLARPAISGPEYNTIRGGSLGSRMIVGVGGVIVRAVLSGQRHMDEVEPRKKSVSYGLGDSVLSPR